MKVKNVVLGLIISLVAILFISCSSSDEAQDSCGEGYDCPGDRYNPYTLTLGKTVDIVLTADDIGSSRTIYYQTPILDQSASYTARITDSTSESIDDTYTGETYPDGGIVIDYLSELDQTPVQDGLFFACDDVTTCDKFNLVSGDRGVLIIKENDYSNINYRYSAKLTLTSVGGTGGADCSTTLVAAACNQFPNGSGTYDNIICKGGTKQELIDAYNTYASDNITNPAPISCSDMSAADVWTLNYAFCKNKNTAENITNFSYDSMIYIGTGSEMSQCQAACNAKATFNGCSAEY